MSDALNRIWGARTKRERVVIALALILLVSALTYAYAWLPVARERDRLLMRVPELRAEATAMERDGSEFEKLKVVARPVAGLAAEIQQAAGSSGLPARSIEIVQRGPESARVTIASVRAEGALTWIGRLQSVPGVTLDSLRLTMIGDGDRVSVDAVLVAQ